MEDVYDFMKTHQYDSDAVKDDLYGNDHQQSNLFHVSEQNMDFSVTCNQFISNIKSMFHSFASQHRHNTRHDLYNKQWNLCRFQQDKYLVIGHHGSKTQRNVTMKYSMVIQNQNYF